jgi:hypothetical protein
VKCYQVRDEIGLEVAEGLDRYLEDAKFEKLKDLSSTREVLFVAFAHARVSMPFQLVPLSLKIPPRQHHKVAERRHHLQKKIIFNDHVKFLSKSYRLPISKRVS